MKKLSIMALLLAIVCLVKGQSVELSLKSSTFTPKEITAEERAKDSAFVLMIKLTDIPLNPSFDSLIIRSIPTNASPEIDYSLLKGAVQAVKPDENGLIQLGILIKSDVIEEGAEFFDIAFFKNRIESTPFATLKVNIKDLNNKPTEKEIPDTARWMVRMVTGSNFDFFDAPIFKNFAGDINLFLPDITTLTIGKSKFLIGLQAGIFNYRYFEADSSQGRMQAERYLLNPNETKLVPGETKYINDLYALNSKSNYNTWGAYLNPMINLGPKNKSKWAQLYMNLHIEMLWRVKIDTYTKVPIRKDTATFNIDDSTRATVLGRYPAIRALYNKRSYFDGYYGIGFPLKVNVKKLFELFVTPAFGYTRFDAQDINSTVTNNIRYRIIESKAVWQPFFLTKFQLTTSVAPINLTLGGEIRKIVGQTPFIAMYLGAAFTLADLKK